MTQHQPTPEITEAQALSLADEIFSRAVRKAQKRQRKTRNPT